MSFEKEIIPRNTLHIDSEVRYDDGSYSKKANQSVENLELYKSKQKTRAGKIIDRILTKEIFLKEKMSMGSSKISKIKIEAK